MPDFLDYWRSESPKNRVLADQELMIARMNETLADIIRLQHIEIRALSLIKVMETDPGRSVWWPYLAKLKEAIDE